MAVVLRMPEVLANATEAVVANWLIAEGESFTAGQPIAEIETEKALIDLPAEQDGILGRVLAQPGEATRVGSPIAVIITAGETAADIDAALGQQSAVTGEGAATEVQDPAAVPRGGAATVTADVAAAVPRQESGGPPPSSTVRRFASPIARRIVREQQLDLDRVEGTGPGGRIVRRDVERALADAPNAPTARAVVPAGTAVAASAVPGADYTAIPHTAMRRAIARRLTESKSTVPHFYLVTDCRVDELLTLRRRINEGSSLRISVNDFVVKAVAAALVDVPGANVTWTDTHLRMHDTVDIAVAVATDGGLLTPVLRGVESLSLSGVSHGIGDLVERARAGRLRQHELEGGSFSVTNLGMYGTSEFSAILNPPQSGILAVGAAKQQAVVADGALAVASVMRCTLSADHRAIDGALAAQWLAAFTARLENPLSMLV